MHLIFTATTSNFFESKSSIELVLTQHTHVSIFIRFVCNISITSIDLDDAYETFVSQSLKLHSGTCIRQQ
jgi:hypothetical protein